MKIFIGMETSGQLRRRLVALGHDVVSCDMLPADDAPTQGIHIIGDVLETLDKLWGTGWWPDSAMFHPTCTYFTNSAEWAYKDPDFDRYPGVGYHQRLKPGTLFGAERRAARERDADYVRQLRALKIRKILFENPVGYLSRVLGTPSQILQPYEHGDDASKKTAVWRYVDGELTKGKFAALDPAKRVPGRMVLDTNLGRIVERWSNQTNQGQSNVTPSDGRWKHRSETFPGIADVLAMELAA